MKTTLVFIHGMFQNDRSWEAWVNYFSAKGYDCIHESWPLHEGDPSALRVNIPEGLGELSLKEVIEKYAVLIQTKDPEAILIGHSVGGLIVQLLLEKGFGSAGVCLSSVAPNRMMSFDLAFFKNSLSIVNPLKGTEPFMMTPEGFHENFCNTIGPEEAHIAYERTATHDSRQVLRDCLTHDGHIDFENVTKSLLFIGGSEDRIIPAELNEKNALAYTNGNAEFKGFSNRSHFICGEPGFEEVIIQVDKWLDLNRKPHFEEKILSI